MSRTKENNPLSTAQRNAAIAPLHSTLPSDEFFTDSLIDNSLISNASHIPSPVKAGPVKPRRALGTSKALQTGRDSGNRSTRTSLFDYTAARTSKQLKPSPKLSRRKSPSPARTNGLTTPPQSRHGPPLNSPTEFSSPPGGLHESYQRIADEEDLAATEREVDSEEDEFNGDDQQDTYETNMEMSPTREGIVTEQSASAQVSQQLTPVQSPSPTRAETERPVDERVESLSEPPTLDFVKNELSDRILAAKLTPHVVDRAKDRARLEKLRQSRIPINFGEKSQEELMNGEHRRNGLASVASRGPISFDNVLAVGANGLHRTYSDTSADFDPRKSVKAFSRATRPGVNKTAPGDDDGSDTPPELREKERLVAFSKSSRRKREDNEERETQRPASVPKVLAFSRAHGRPRPHGTPSETVEGQGQPDDPTVASVASTASEPLPGTTPRPNEERATRSFLARWRKETAERRASKTREDADPSGSQIDWAAAAADVPLPSIEKSSTPQETPPRTVPSSIQKQRSMERMRKWENDFTGLSFQVSESPPVRTRTNVNDTLREKEIEDLAKKAVTTNRLDEIREKDLNVIVRKTSRNFSPQERKSVPPEPQEAWPKADNIDLKNLGEAVPDTPVVVYRSSSSSTDKSKASQRSMPDSLDQLQRLARAVSTTPRQSPAALELSVALDDASAVPLPPSEDDLKSQSSLADHEDVDNKKKVAETPRVTGAWTDTILPDTIKTRNQTQRISKFAQTPHVNAGGWIDTPLPNGDRVLDIQIPRIVEEETEELTNGESPTDNATADHMEHNTTPPAASLKEGPGHKSGPQKEEVILPKSALTNVLNEAKQKRLVSRDITDAPRDENDTLNLGDATIQSFEDLLTDAADITADLTSLIKAGAEEEVLALRERNKLTASIALDDDNSTASEVAFIGHLTSRMERLMSNLHEARKGIARLEQKVSHTPSIPLVGPDQQTQALVAVEDPNKACARCGRSSDDIDGVQQPVTISSFMALPIAYTTFTLPIPLLFHPRTASQDSKGRIRLINLLPGNPTWLGYLTLSIWIWYILECVLAEIYARPLYAERYIWPTRPEPEFPFVLPTMLYRWSLGGSLGSVLIAPVVTVSGVTWRLIVAVWKVMGMWLGWTDGFVDDDRTRSFVATATKSAAQAFKSLVSGPDGADSIEVEGLSMMNDEIL
ncbi:uncharacterized protein Z520_00159 [Fonsecaea multimorphosa CBS 102226]|uniref:Uncharacterized protein n=1 Tax=Fonsecaea multimorphosa CBS 102226 TaxID=1442371 RepID=A0A0D2KBP2_9EURO|nr:uncharacterized protein Z520_00159 [Fonsecaea multimorphosa CBS 102226]KIY03468.1 hypothetical protein Z520_00159 [Fonsecaea multimorphosa CBS 102226]OAL32726.1 hypothetical protein AYO22_00200 [Fonsecaea multimorphosa]